MNRPLFLIILTIVLLIGHATLTDFYSNAAGLNAWQELLLILLVPLVFILAQDYGFGLGSKRISRRFLRKVIDAVPSMIFVKDRKGRFVMVNQALADMYGTTVDGIVGRTDEDFNKDKEEVEHFHSDDNEVIDYLRDKFIPEEEATDSNGITRFYQTVKRPLRLGLPGPVHVLGVATDITEAKRLQGELIQAQKMDAVGQLAGGIAHDFNNLLTAILGHTELLKIYGGDSPEVLRSAELIQSAIHQAAQLTTKLLGFARKGKHENVPVDLHAIIEESLQLLERTMSGQMTIIKELNAETPKVLGDAVQLQQVVINLAINSRDAIAQKFADNKAQGIFAIKSMVLNRADCLEFEDLPVEGERFVELAFSDNGCGIQANHIPKVFEPFFTTKGPGKGTGMGLSMVYGIIKNHGGGISISSKEGIGTTVKILLVPLENGTSIEKSS